MLSFFKDKVALACATAVLLSFVLLGNVLDAYVLSLAPAERIAFIGKVFSIMGYTVKGFMFFFFWLTVYGAIRFFRQQSQNKRKKETQP